VISSRANDRFVYGRRTYERIANVSAVGTATWIRPRRRSSFQNMFAASGTSTRPTDENVRVSRYVVPACSSTKRSTSGTSHSSEACRTAIEMKIRSRNRSRPKNRLHAPLFGATPDSSLPSRNVRIASNITVTPDAGSSTNSDAR
jgi:hypothetical protein